MPLISRRSRSMNTRITRSSHPPPLAAFVKQLERKKEYCSDERDLPQSQGIGGCSPAILKSVGRLSGMSPIFPSVDRSRTLGSEPFSSQLATDQRSKNSCA